ncbi:MAG: metallophosphoesterase [Cytophagaceae bacterium]|nr:metallophosphoesterase [Cytophagaceae bacterium]
MKKKFLFIILFILFFYCSCTRQLYISKEAKNWEKQTPPDSTQLIHTVFLLGDAGDPLLINEEPNFKLFRQHIEKDSNSTVLFLGDNIYHDGLPEESAPGRDKAEEKLLLQLNMLENYRGKVYFIPGNHDWDYMKAGGYEAILRQERFLEDTFKRGNVFIPDNGCPGPVMVRVNKDIIFLAIDSQWWLHKYQKPYGRSGDCTAEDEADFLAQLEDFLEANKNKHIIVSAHHPLVSNGNHGGFYTFSDYMFPLRLIRSNLYIPVPILGSLYPLHRKFGGTDQDLAHYKYQDYKNDLLNVLNNYKNIIYTAGHEHNLQYHKLDSIYHVLSGSGSKLTPLRGGNEATFAQHSKGFAILKYYKNTEVWLEFWIPEKDGSGKMSFRTKLYKKRESGPELYCSITRNDYSDSTVMTSADEKYRSKKINDLFFREHYKNEWSQNVQVSLLDIKNEKDGILPYGKTGGKQKQTLRFKDIEDREFKFTSLKKSISAELPEEITNDFLHGFPKVKLSGQYPYGSLIIPKLSSAAGIFYTNPKLVLIPNDSCLGPYRAGFKNSIGIFEENLIGDHTEAPSLGKSKEIIGTGKVIYRIEEDFNNKVDERAFARSRLMDMLLGDWDKDESEYRWASFERGNFTWYKPIPAEQDQAFFKLEGFVPWLLSKKWMIRNFQNFDEDIDDLKGLNMSAKAMDRKFLTTLTKDDWIEIADSIKLFLTDEVIEAAVHSVPEEIFAIHGKEIIAKLKARRDQLSHVAINYYTILSRYVNVFGCRQNDKFEVIRMDNKKTAVRVFRLNERGQTTEKVYERIFFEGETKEIRLYGLEGTDVFNVTGKVNKGIILRIIGGKGTDTITDHSSVKGFNKKTVIYDTRKENIIKASKETNLDLSPAESVHIVEQDKFYYNYTGPLTNLYYYNPDDGLFSQVGLIRRTYKFRNDPFSTQHKLSLAYGTNNSSLRILYQNEIKKAVNALDLETTIRISAPYVMNFYGSGNESVKLNERLSDFRVNISNAFLNVTINKTFTHFFTIGIGPKYESFKVDGKENRLLQDGSFNFTNENKYGGIRAFLRLGTADNPLNPTRGIFLLLASHYNLNINTGKNYSQQTGEFKFYITPNLPYQLTFACRIGGAFNTGRYEFYQANMLGGANMLNEAQNLRGFHKTRFIGDQSFYQNVEARMELMKFNFYLFPSKFGLLGLIDNGKIWVNNFNSKKWHTGYGGGLWINIFNKLVFSATYSFSKEDSLFNLKSGFSF